MGSTTEEPERSLIRRARQGNRDAFALIVRLYYQRVYRVAVRFVRNDDDAAELTQETFIRAMRSLHRFDGERALFPWLYQIVRNLSLNRIARVRNRESGLPDYDLEDRRIPGPEQMAIRDEDGRAVQAAILRLSGQAQEIIRLAHYEECSYQEMAEILDIPVGTVMSRLYNARKKLREILAAEEEDHE